MEKIEPIEDVDRRQEIRQIYKRLIKSINPLEVLFQPEIEGCIMFYPFVDGARLEKDQYEAVTAAAKLLGDEGFVLSQLYGDSGHRKISPDFEYKGFPPTDDDWVEIDGETVSEPHWCEFPTHKDYGAVGYVPPLDHVLYSINGSWAVVCAYEEHALVGGSLDFIRIVDQIYPQWRISILKMIDNLSRIATREWPRVKLLLELIQYWKRYPADEWVETVTDKLNRKLDGQSEIRYANGTRSQGAPMGKIESIEDVDRRQEIAKIGQSLFQSQNPHKMTFKPEVEACLMFHTLDADDPYYPDSPLDYLTRGQYQAIIAAAKRARDTGFVLSQPHGSLMNDTDYWRRVIAPGAAADTNWTDLEDHWWCEFPTYEDYLTIGPVGILDVALFSIHGHWGVFTARHTLVGGNIDFIRHVDKMYPAWRNEVIELIDNWEGQIKRDDPMVNLLIELLEYWKRYPADEWVETVADKLSRKLEYRVAPFSVHFI